MQTCADQGPHTVHLQNGGGATLPRILYPGLKIKEQSWQTPRHARVCSRVSPLGWCYPHLQVIPASGYPVLIAVNWSQHWCAISFLLGSQTTVSDKNSWDTLAKRCFFPSRAHLVPLKVVYRGSVTKSCTPTLRGQGDPKVSQPFRLRLYFWGILGMWLLVGSSGGKSLGRYIHVLEPFFSGKTLEISRTEREKTINRGKKSVSLITIFRSIKKSFLRIRFKEWTTVESKLRALFRRLVSCRLNILYRWRHD